MGVSTSAARQVVGMAELVDTGAPILLGSTETTVTAIRPEICNTKSFSTNKIGKLTSTRRLAHPRAMNIFQHSNYVRNESIALLRVTSPDLRAITGGPGYGCRSGATSF